MKKVDDSKLTAFALDDLHPIDRLEVSRFLSDNPTEWSDVMKTREVAGMLKKAMQSQDTPGLTSEQRDEIFAEAARASAKVATVKTGKPVTAISSRRTKLARRWERQINFQAIAACLVAGIGLYGLYYGLTTPLGFGRNSRVAKSANDSDQVMQGSGLAKADAGKQEMTPGSRLDQAAFQPSPLNIATGGDRFVPRTPSTDLSKGIKLKLDASLAMQPGSDRLPAEQERNKVAAKESQSVRVISPEIARTVFGAVKSSDDQPIFVRTDKNSKNFSKEDLGSQTPSPTILNVLGASGPIDVSMRIDYGSGTPEVVFATKNIGKDAVTLDQAHLANGLNTSGAFHCTSHSARVAPVSQSVPVSMPPSGAKTVTIGPGESVEQRLPLFQSFPQIKEAAGSGGTFTLLYIYENPSTRKLGVDSVVRTITFKLPGEK